MTINSEYLLLKGQKLKIAVSDILNNPELILHETDIIGQRINREENPKIVANLCMIISNSNLIEYIDYIKQYFSRDELIEIYSDDRIKTVTLANIARYSYDKMKNIF